MIDLERDKFLNSIIALFSSEKTGEKSRSRSHFFGLICGRRCFIKYFKKQKGYLNIFFFPFQNLLAVQENSI